MAKDVERRPVMTAASVAQEHFRRELIAQDTTEMCCRTVVFIRDSCYGHRYSRPRTSKAALSTIVERPERLHACVLGASTAYVRMGGRHAGGNFPPRPDRDIPPPPFQIRRIGRSIPLESPAVTQVHGQRWMEELQIMCDSAEGKLAMNGKELVRPIGYGKDEAGNQLPKLHEGDLYLCSESLDALQGCLGGVCEAVDAVLGPGTTTRAFVCIRPPGHHCSSNVPSGFCWLNNVHVGIAHAAMSQGLTHAAIIDFDLHHGDGSQAIAWNHNRRAAGNLPKNSSLYSKTAIGYFSLHDINSYPCEGGDEEKIKNASLCIEAAHGQSIWNVHLEPWKNPSDFWKLYESRYILLLEKTRIFLRQHTARLEGQSNGPRPKAAIFLSAGFDASEWEGAGMQRHKVNVPTDFYARFTQDVTKLADEEGLGVGGRIISVLEGGYSDRALTSGVLSHLCGLTSGPGPADLDTAAGEADLNSSTVKQTGTLNMTAHTRQMSGEESTVERDSATEMSYNPEWWSSLQLEALEALIKPVPAPSAPVKPKDKAPGNYSSPTQASTAKMTDPARERRSLSAQAEGRVSMEPEVVQPPPDVDWAVASRELSQLLIPTDRQTLSCRHDELNAEATKVRRERQSAIGLTSNDVSAVDQRMQLRDRRARPLANEELGKGVVKADRRKTIAAAGDLPGHDSVKEESSETVVSAAGNRPRRRSSAGSSMMSAFENMNLNDREIRPSEARVVTNRGHAVPNKTKILTLPAKATNAPIQKKVRPPTAVKGQPIKAKTGPKKAVSAPPIPRSPSASVNSSSAASNKERKIKPDQGQSAPKPGSSATVVDGVDEVDPLSSGMRKMKINLKVAAPEDNAARERGVREEKEKQKKNRAPRKPAVSKAAKGPLLTDNLQSDSVESLISSTTVRSGIDHQNATLASPISPIAQAEEQPKPTQHRDEAASTNDYVPTAVIAHAEPPLQATILAPVPAPVEVQTTASIASAVRPSDYTPLERPWNEAQASTGSAGPIHSSTPTSPHLELQNSALPPSSPAPASAPATGKKTRASLPQFTASSPIPFARPDPTCPSPQLAKEVGKAVGPGVSDIQPTSTDNGETVLEWQREVERQAAKSGVDDQPPNRAVGSAG